MQPVKALFIGQAPPRIIDERPFGRTHLYKWLQSIGITPEVASQDFAFTALVTIFPGMRGSSHRPPSPEEIAAERPALLQIITTTQPSIIIPVGSLSTREVLQNEKVAMHSAVGQRFYQTPFGADHLQPRPIIPFPHPSGASRWIYQENHHELLAQALQLFKEELKKLSS